MSKLTTAGMAALFTAITIAAFTVPAAAKDHHGHHGHHGGFGFEFDFGGPYIYDEPDPIYCIGRHGQLFVCGYN